MARACSRASRRISTDIAQRVNRSALAIGPQAHHAARPIVDLVREGMKKFAPEHGALCEADVLGRSRGPGHHRARSGFDPVLPVALRGADAGAGRSLGDEVELPAADARIHADGFEGRRLYPNNARALREAKAKGFDNALVCDALGNVAETATSNVFMAKDGVVYTPAPNGTFLNGITRQRVIQLLRDDGVAGGRGAPCATRISPAPTRSSSRATTPR